MYGTRVSPALLVWAVGAWAAGLGIRAVPRVFEVDAHTVLRWLVETAAHLQAFSQYVLHDVRVTQLQLDELYALRSQALEPRFERPRPAGLDDPTVSGQVHLHYPQRRGTRPTLEKNAQ